MDEMQLVYKDNVLNLSSKQIRKILNENCYYRARPSLGTKASKKLIERLSCSPMVENRIKAASYPEFLSDELLKKLSQDPSHWVCYRLLCIPQNFRRLTADEIIKSVDGQDGFVDAFSCFVHLHPEDDVLIDYYSKYSNIKIRDYFNKLLNHEIGSFEGISLLYKGKLIDITVEPKVLSIRKILKVIDLSKKSNVTWVRSLVLSQNPKIKKIVASIPEILSDDFVKILAQDSFCTVRSALLGEADNFRRLSAKEIIDSIGNQYWMLIQNEELHHPEIDQLVRHYLISKNVPCDVKYILLKALKW